MKASLITEERLKQALIDQKKAGLKLGQFLTRLGIVSEQQIIDMLSQQLKIAKYHPDHYPLDIELIRFIPIRNRAEISTGAASEKRKASDRCHC